MPSQLRTDDRAVVESLARQSVLPTEVWCEGLDDDSLDALRERGVLVRQGPEGELAETSADFVGQLDRVVPRTHFEDLLLSQDFGPFDRMTTVS